MVTTTSVTTAFARGNNPFWLLFLIALPQPFGTSILLPAMDQIAQDLQASAGVVHMIVAAFLLGMAAGQLVLGPLSDVFGRKAVLLGGLALFSATNGLAFFAQDTSALVMLRFLQGFGGTAGVAMARAMLRDATEGDQTARALSLLLVGMSVGPLLGPYLGGVVTQYIGWRWSFAVMGALNTVTLLAAVIFARETHPPMAARKAFAAQVLSNFALLLRSPSFRFAILAQASAGALYYAIMSFISEVAVGGFGLSNAEQGQAYLLCALGSTMGALTSSAFVARFGVMRMSLAGSGLAALCMGVATTAFASGTETAAYVFIPVLIGQIGVSIVLPCTTAAVLGVPRHLTGAAVGLGTFCQLASSALVFSGIGKIGELGLIADLGLMAGMLSIGFAILAQVMMTQKRREDGKGQ